jgi:hypothetical protein
MLSVLADNSPGKGADNRSLFFWSLQPQVGEGAGSTGGVKQVVVGCAGQGADREGEVREGCELA